MRAPVETPVTMSKRGRLPASDQPTRTPAPKAPSAPPPETARTFNASFSEPGQRCIRLVDRDAGCIKERHRAHGRLGADILEFERPPGGAAKQRQAQHHQ